jgi:glycosyltransferase involved in cell wall biosynthesis
MNKIAFINELYGTRRQGGEQEAMQELAKRLNGVPDLSVDIFSYKNKDKKKTIKSIIPLFFRQLPFFRDVLVLPFIGYRLIRKIENDYDILHSSSITLFSLYKPRKPYFITCHAIRSQKVEKLSKIKKYRFLFNPLFKIILKYLEKRGLKNATEIIVIKDEMKNYLIERMQISDDKVKIIPNAVDIDKFKPDTLNTNDKKNILFVGRGTVPKGIDTIIEMAKNIEEKILIVTKLIGSNFFKLGQERGIEFMFNVSHSEINKIYNKAKIFILPSLDEEQPLTILEAMSSGLPIITTRVGSGNLVQDGINGIIISPQNSKELAEAINKLTSNRELVEKIKKTNRAKVEQNFSWKSVVKKYIELYDQL